MSDMKTKQNDADVDAFLNSVENKKRVADARIILNMMIQITGKPAKMWGPSIIGFGNYEYNRKDGSAHQFCVTALSPRKAALTVYIMPGFEPFDDLMGKLGKYKNSVSCLYVTKLDNIDLEVLEELIKRSVDIMKERYETDL